MHFYETQHPLAVPAKVHLREYDQLSLQGGQFYVRGYLGTGGFGHVYHVQQDPSGPDFALKLLRLWERPLAEHEALRGAFDQEARVGQIDSPHLVHTHAAGQIDGNPYLLMAYCPKGDLATRYAAFHKEPACMELARQILRGLRDLHAHHWIHRDLKPSNLLFDAHDQVRLADFGTAIKVQASLAGTGGNEIATGSKHWRTALFCAPEQLFARHQTGGATPATDIFAFGILMYFVLSKGHFPFGGQNAFEQGRNAFFQRMRRGKWEPLQTYRPDLIGRWPTIIQRCLQYDPRRRYPEVSDLLAELETTAPDLRQSTPIRTPPKRWQLRVVQGPSLTFDLTELSQRKGEGLLTIGSEQAEDSESNDLLLPADQALGVAAKHATLSLRGERWHLQSGQLDSARKWIVPHSGTLVNNQYIRQGEAKPLHLGDLIRVGQVTLRVEYGVPPER